MNRLNVQEFLHLWKENFPLKDASSITKLIHNLLYWPTTTNKEDVQNDATLILISIILGYFEDHFASMDSNCNYSILPCFSDNNNQSELHGLTNKNHHHLSSSTQPPPPSPPSSSPLEFTFEECETLLLQFLDLLENPRVSLPAIKTISTNITTTTSSTRSSKVRKKNTRQRNGRRPSIEEEQENKPSMDLIPTPSPALSDLSFISSQQQQQQQTEVEEGKTQVKEQPSTDADCGGGALTKLLKEFHESTMKDYPYFVSSLNQLILKPLGSRKGKDPHHYQSIYSLLKYNYVDAFGLAYAVIATAYCLKQLESINLDEICILSLSEDHVWIEVSKQFNTHFTTKQQKWMKIEVYDNKNTPVGFLADKENSDNSWLYLAGHPIHCNSRAMCIAAAVTAMDCHRKSSSANNTASVIMIQELQFCLLKMLHDETMLSNYPLALSTLGELYEKLNERLSLTTMYHNLSANDENKNNFIISLHYQAIKASNELYDNRLVYPHIALADYYLHQQQYRETFLCWANAAGVISKYNYTAGDSEIYNEFLNIVEKLMPHVLRDISRQKVNQSNVDLQCIFSSFLRFFDGLCKWEEDSSRPVLHIGWIKKFINSLQCFSKELRTSFYWFGNAEDEEDEEEEEEVVEEEDLNVEDGEGTKDSHVTVTSSASSSLPFQPHPPPIEMARKSDGIFDDEDTIAIPFSMMNSHDNLNLKQSSDDFHSHPPPPPHTYPYSSHFQEEKLFSTFHEILGEHNFFHRHHQFHRGRTSPMDGGGSHYSIGSSLSPITTGLLDDDVRSSYSCGFVSTLSQLPPMADLMRPDWLDSNASLDDIMPVVHLLLTHKWDLFSLPPHFVLHNPLLLSSPSSSQSPKPPAHQQLEEDEQSYQIVDLSSPLPDIAQMVDEFLREFPPHSTDSPRPTSSCSPPPPPLFTTISVSIPSSSHAACYSLPLISSSASSTTVPSIYSAPLYSSSLAHPPPPVPVSFSSTSSAPPPHPSSSSCLQQQQQQQSPSFGFNRIRGVKLYSRKMRSVRDLITAAKLNLSAIELTLTAQSQVHLKRTDLRNSSYSLPRKRLRRNS